MNTYRDSFWGTLELVLDDFTVIALIRENRPPFTANRGGGVRARDVAVKVTFLTVPELSAAFLG